jgi:diguanylate cyclase (GGDEF)-like protein
MDNMRRALALVLQQRAQVLALERAARIDHLTGVVARARFFDLLDRLEEDAPDGASHAVLYIDLDGFKGVNDNFGHAAGDRVLTVAAQRMAAVTPERSLLARLGGDEFVVVCPAGTDDETAVALAQAIIDVFASPIDVDGMAARVGASVGVAVGLPGQRPQAVLDAADRALLAAKADGRSRWRRAPI